MIIAVIDIGTSAIRLVMAEIDKKNKTKANGYTILERAEQPTSLAKDIFTKKIISRLTVDEIVSSLDQFKQLIEPYEPDTITAFATTTFKEAKNFEIILNQISEKAGIELTMMTGIQTNQLTYLAVDETLKKAFSNLHRYNSLIMEVGAGNTELMGLKRGKITASHTLPLGAMRYAYEEGIEKSQLKVHDMHSQRILEMLALELDFKKISRFIAVGGDARHAAHICSCTEKKGVFVLEKGNFLKLVEQLTKMESTTIAEQYAMTMSDADLLVPALLIFRRFFLATNAQELIVPANSIREGMLMQYTFSPDVIHAKFLNQTISSARNLARHYKMLNSHCEYVRKNTLILFDFLKNDFALTKQDRDYLEIAAILHDIGTFISASGHHKHGHYIIQNSELFGLDETQKTIIANIVRYHRKALPNRNHQSYASLQLKHRLTIQKLSAILRLADALDRSHSGHVGISTVEIRKNKFVITTDYTGDINMEQRSLKSKSNYFQEIFGMTVQLKQAMEA